MGIVVIPVWIAVVTAVGAGNSVPIRVRERRPVWAIRALDALAPLESRNALDHSARMCSFLTLRFSIRSDEAAILTVFPASIIRLWPVVWRLSSLAR